MGGPPSAGVTIIEFLDFQCPFCQESAAYLSEIRRRYPKEVSVIYRHFPAHQLAMPAAIASLCANEQGAFEAMHDLLFAQMDSIGEKTWTRFATEAGVPDTVRFGACLDEPRMRELVVQDTLAARQLGVHGTPSFLINDLLLAGFHGAKEMDRLLERAIGFH